MAVSLRGGLAVPVLRDADTLKLNWTSTARMREAAEHAHQRATDARLPHALGHHLRAPETLQ